MSFGTVLNTPGFRPAGFDYLRICLSLSVILWHTVIVCYGISAELPFWTGWPRPIIFFIIPAFFALSGFLVAGSAQRNTVPRFLALRAIRIYPALSCEVIISAFLIGPMITTFAIIDYFSDPIFFRYLLNTIGYIHYYLPGVFENNPAGPAVNIQLWTVPHELECYIAITLLVLLGCLRRPLLLATALVGLTIFAVTRDQNAVAFARAPGRLLVLSFLSGVLIYVWKDKIPNSGLCFAACLAISWFCLSQPALMSLSAFPVAYVIVWLGVRNPHRTFLINGADYSYGMYLYGYPIQQLLAYLLPDLRIWYVNGTLGIILSAAAAYLSWHLIEHPIMKRKDDILALLQRPGSGGRRGHEDQARADGSRALRYPT